MPQIEEIYARCDYGSADYSADDCMAYYSADPLNRACLLCLYSVEGDPSYGPIIFMSDGSVWANIGGCVALVGGDMTADSCGAKVWAATQCRDTACMSCFEAEYADCVVAASRTVCQAYAQAAICSRDAAYAACNHPTWMESFFALGAMFCQASGDAGRASDSAADAVSDASEGSAPSSDRQRR